LASEPQQQGRPQLSEVDHPGRDAVGMQGEPQDVDWGFEQLGSGALGEQREGVVRGDDAGRS